MWKNPCFDQVGLQSLFGRIPGSGEDHGVTGAARKTKFVINFSMD